MKLLRTNYPVVDPFDVVDSFFHRAFGDFGRQRPTATTSLAVDVQEDDTNYYVATDLPGFRKEDVQVSVENGVLSIEATRGQKDDDTASKSTHRRSLTLPDGIRSDQVGAHLENGVLLVTLPKGENEKTRLIEVR